MITTTAATTAIAEGKQVSEVPQSNVQRRNAGLLLAKLSVSSFFILVPMDFHNITIETVLQMLIAL